MDQHTLSQLEKIVALTDSDHEGEALSALRKARDLLARQGLCFSDLGRAAAKAATARTGFGLFSKGPTASALEIASVRQQLNDIQSKVEDADLKADHYRQKASLLEQRLSLSQAEAARWQQLAREAVDKLWDLGLSVPESVRNPSKITSKRA